MNNQQDNLGFIPDAPGTTSAISSDPNELGFVADGQTTPAPAASGGGGGTLNKIENVLSALAPGTKGLGEAIGTLGGYGYTALKEKLGLVPKGTTSQYDLSAPTPVQELGNAGMMLLQGASMGVPAGVAAAVPGLAEAAPLGSTLFKGAGLAPALGRIAVQGGIGFGMGASGAIGAGETDWKKIAQNGLVGTAWSAGLASAGELGSALVDNMASKTGTTQLTAKKDDLKTLKNAFNDTSTQTTNPIKTLDENGLVKDLRVIDGKISTEGLTNVNRTGSIDQLIESQQEMGTQAVGQMEGSVTTEKFKTTVIDSIKSNPALQSAGKVSKTVAEVSRMFDDYKESFGDNIDYKKINGIRVAMNREWNPETWDAEKAVGTAARGLLYNGTGAGKALQSAMQNEQEMINAKEFIIKLNGVAVKGGRLGKYIADATAGVIGSIAAAPLGPVGSGVGAMASGYAADKLMGVAQGNYFNPLRGRIGQGLQNIFMTPAANTLENYGKTAFLGNILGNKGKP